MPQSQKRRPKKADANIGANWDNYLELIGIYFQEELRLLKSRPGWLYVKDEHKLDAIGEAYQKASDKVKEELGN